MSFSLFSTIVYRVRSEINGEVIVREHLGQHTLYIQGMPQSGGIVNDIWSRGVANFPDLPYDPQILLLGLGGGTVVNLIKKIRPMAQILSVEIDPQIAAIAKIFFKMMDVHGLEIAVDDAKEMVEKRKNGVRPGKFDLILVDLYIGSDLPEFVEGEKFASQLRDLVENKGTVVFNRLYGRKDKERVYQFEEKMKKIFPKVKGINLNTNYLLFCSCG